MTRNYPETIPETFQADALADAYRRGWSHGHGIACHNVPTLGDEMFTYSLGRVTVDAENIREVHEDACFETADNSRSYSPFEFTAHEFNSADDDEASGESSEELWEAFETGTADAIRADLAEYTDEDYGIEAEPLETSDFIAAYFESMEFTDCHSDNTELDGADFSDELTASSETDCEDFITANDALLRSYLDAGRTMSDAGHDFWLTRNGHGAGFWDRGLPGDLGDRLSEAAKVYGSVDLYAGDDGLVYGS